MRPVHVLMIALLAACSNDYGFADTKPDVPEPVDSDPPVVESDIPVVEETVPEETDVPDDVVDEETPAATAPVYANTRDSLYEVDPATGVTTLIGPFTDNGSVVDGMVDIAIDNRGRLFGGDRGPGPDGPYGIWRIDPSDANSYLVCTVDVELVALAFTSDGVLVAGGGTDLVTVDVDNGCDTDLLYRGTWETSGDIVGLPDGLLYWTVRGDDSDELVVVDPRTRLSGFRGVISFDRLYGLGYDEQEARLYGFSANGDIVEIVPADGEGSLLAADAATPWWGATTNPVVW
jgi:hypothetical protein